MNLTTRIFENYNAFINRVDKTVNGVSPEFAIFYPNWQQMNETNKGCWNCVNCTFCENCTHCHNSVKCINTILCNGCIECRDYVHEY